jgi:hypothetical protein
MAEVTEIPQCIRLLLHPDVRQEADNAPGKRAGDQVSMDRVTGPT